MTPEPVDANCYGLAVLCSHFPFGVTKPPLRSDETRTLYKVTVPVKLKRSVHNRCNVCPERLQTTLYDFYTTSVRLLYDFCTQLYPTVRLLYDFCTAGQQADHEASTPWHVLHGPACYVQPCYSYSRYRPTTTATAGMAVLQLQLQPCYCATITSLCMHMGDTGLVLHLVWAPAAGRGR